VGRKLFTDFHKFFHCTLCRQFAITWLLYIPPHRKCVLTLPCETQLQEKLTIIANKRFGKRTSTLLTWYYSVYSCYWYSMLQNGSHYSHITVHVTAFDQTFILRLTQNRLILNEMPVVLTAQQYTVQMPCMSYLLHRCPSVLSVRLLISLRFYNKTMPAKITISSLSAPRKIFGIRKALPPIR